MNLRHTPLSLPATRSRRWKHILYESVLALASTALLTGLIARLQLASRLPDSVLLYLFVILILAYQRGLYSSLLASMLAFFSFDFLFVAPIYSLRVTKFEDILTLIVFLLTATITAQLAIVIKGRTQKTHQQLREAQILYEIVCAANQEKLMEDQLRTFIHAIVELFTPWGIQDGMVLLYNNAAQLTQVVARSSSPEPESFLSCEEKLLTQTLIEGFPAAITLAPSPSDTGSPQLFFRFSPLKVGQRVVGILRLSIRAIDQKEVLPPFLQAHTLPTSLNLLFSTLLEQAVTVIERDRLLHENIDAQVLYQTEGLRAALLSSVSHNLRTPLSTIKTAATSLQEEGPETGENMLIETILHETDRMDNLVENLLDMSRIEAGVLHPQKDWYILSEIVYDVLERMQPLLAGRAIQLHIPAELAPIELDYVHIDQVLTNLLENALYYTPVDSSLEIDLREEAKQVLLSISDRGPGIPLDAQEHIFDKFYRLPENTVSQHSKGTGLGLSICRGLIQAHGGQIWVEAREGGGARFCFTLPRGSSKGMITWDA